MASKFDFTEFDLIHDTYDINYVDRELKQNFFLSHLDQCTFIVVGKITKSSWLLMYKWLIGMHSFVHNILHSITPIRVFHILKIFLKGIAHKVQTCTAGGHVNGHHILRWDSTNEASLKGLVLQSGR